jgi:hypothetical protein
MVPWLRIHAYAGVIKLVDIKKGGLTEDGTKKPLVA